MVDNTEVWTIPYQWHHMQIFDGNFKKNEPDDEKEGSHQVARSHQVNYQTLVNAIKDKHNNPPGPFYLQIFTMPP